MADQLAAKGDLVARQTSNLLQYKSQNDELQKWRVVLESRYNDMNSLVGPKHQEIENLRRSIAQNENTLRNLKLMNAKDSHSLEEMENEINSLYNEILKTENHTAAREAKIQQFKNAVHRVYTECEPNQWEAEVKVIHNEFVKGNIVDDTDPALADTFLEFERHKISLEERVAELKDQAIMDTQSTGNSALKQTMQNQDLINEVARLREENQNLRSQIHFEDAKISQLLNSSDKKTKSIREKLRSLCASPNLIRKPDTAQTKQTKSGITMTVEHFTPD